MTRLRSLAALVCVACVAAPAATADGDPASDYLLTRDTFIPFNAKIPQKQTEMLDAIVAMAKKRGFRIKVALISSYGDLGAVPSLWREPKTYARFLGQEIFFIYKGRLLIVMPNGYGVSRAGKPLQSAQRVLDMLPKPGEGGPALAAAANRGVQRLAAQEGVQLEIPTVSSGDNAGHDRIVIAVIAVVIVLLFVAGFAGRRLLARR
jgi:hypothetical protein